MKNHLLIHRVSRILVLTAAGAAFLAAQQGRLAGPLAGYVFDRQSQALRPILGIPGASTMGDPINIGFAVADAYVAPRQDAAVVVSTDGSLHIFRLDAGVATEHQVAGLAGTPQRVAFSPSGTAAALYAAGQLQVILGLPGAPALAATFPITLAGAAASSGGPGQPHPRGTPAASLAISDDGAYLLTVSSGEVRLTATGVGSSVTLASAGSNAMVAFAPGGHDAAEVDPGSAGLVLWPGLGGNSIPRTLAPPDKSFASPVGLAFSADAKTLFIANASDQSVAQFDVTSGDRIATFAAHVKPAELVAMGQTFRVNEPGTGPLWLLDTGTNGPRMVFVPALQIAEQVSPPVR
jgi:hypothetical protein